MQATARRLSVVSATSCARRRLIQGVRPSNRVQPQSPSDSATKYTLRDQTMNPDTLFKNMMGMDMAMMQRLTIMSGFCVFVLLCYRLHVIVDCMRRPPSEFPAASDRIVWTGLAALIPLGIGAYLYHVVLLRRPLQWFFITPFSIILLTTGYLLVKIWPMSTKFSFNFLGI